MTPEEINKKIVETIPAEIDREMQDRAALVPGCDFCHARDMEDREKWCVAQFRHFFIAGLRTERERQMKEAAYFPEYDSIVDKVFGAGNIESWERDEAERLVRLAKAELLKELAASPTIKGWVARDKNGEVWFYMQKPHRNGRMWTTGSGDGRYVIYLAHISFPGLGWEDEPIEVELPIIRK